MAPRAVEGRGRQVLTAAAARAASHDDAGGYFLTTFKNFGYLGHLENAGWVSGRPARNVLGYLSRKFGGYLGALSFDTYNIRHTEAGSDSLARLSLLFFSCFLARPATATRGGSPPRLCVSWKPGRPTKCLDEVDE